MLIPKYLLLQIISNKRKEENYTPLRQNLLSIDSALSTNLLADEDEDFVEGFLNKFWDACNWQKYVILQPILICYFKFIKSLKQWIKKINRMH